MPVNNYLINGVNPSNNESSIPLDKIITITFSKHMNPNTLTAANLVFREVNGAIVPYTLTYLASSMTAKLQPNEALSPGKQYQLQILGTQDGILSITGDYLGITRTYEFTTSHNVTLSEPENIAVNLTNNYPVVSWTRPSDYDAGANLTYEVQISVSNIPETSLIFPAVGDVNVVSSLLLNVPKQLDEGNYYFYVRAINGEEKSEWASTQIYVDALPTTTVTPPVGGGGIGGGGGNNTPLFTFDVQEVYPGKDTVDINPEQIIVVFTEDIDMDTVTEDTIYVVKKADKENLSFIDLMTAYSPANKIPVTFSTLSEKVLLIVPEVDAIENDSEYTVILSSSVASLNGDTLGAPYHWSFISKYTILYGDVSLIRSDLGPLSAFVSDRTLYEYMSEASEYIYQLASVSQNFDESLYQDGNAPYYIHQLVRLTAAYNLSLKAQTHGTDGFTTDITLGDLQVSKEAGKAGDSASLLLSLKERMKPLMDMLHGHNNRGYAKPVAVVKGENVESYPEFLTRSEFKELGQ